MAWDARFATLMGSAGGARNGILIEAPTPLLVPGRAYSVTGMPSELGEESVLTSIQWSSDPGPATDPPIASRSARELSDTSCDPGQVLETGEDWEGTVARAVDVRVIQHGVTGASFNVLATTPVSDDTLLVRNETGIPFQPRANQFLNITGVLRQDQDRYSIVPRDLADIQLVSAWTPQTEPSRIASLQVFPNPATGMRLRFSLSVAAATRVSIVDIQGRTIGVLADRTLPAGEHELEWPGRGPGTRRPSPGLYFAVLEAQGARRISKLVLVD